MAAAWVPASAGAVPITITGGSWTQGSGWGAACTIAGCDGESTNHTLLNMDWGINAGLAQTFNLDNVNDTFWVTFGTGRFSDENNTLESGETDGLSIAAILNLGLPSAVNAGSGVASTATGTLSDAHADLSIAFAPVIVSFGSGGELTVDLSDPSWTCNPGLACKFGNSQTQTITALFTLTALPDAVLSARIASVPEPTTLALIALALTGLGLSRRKRPT